MSDMPTSHPEPTSAVKGGEASVKSADADILGRRAEMKQPSDLGPMESAEQGGEGADRANKDRPTASKLTSPEAQAVPRPADDENRPGFVAERNLPNT